MNNEKWGARNALFNVIISQCILSPNFSPSFRNVNQSFSMIVENLFHGEQSSYLLFVPVGT